MGPVELASCSFGQSSKISYLQMANAVATIVNGGKLMQPYLVENIYSAQDGEKTLVQHNEPVVRGQAISEETSNIMRQLMEQVVLQGGGKNAYVAGYRIGGKSGTSQKLDSEDENARIGSFVGMAPADDPQIVVLVCLDEPHSFSSMGGTISAPVVAEVMEKTLEYLGVPRQYTAEEQQRMQTQVPNVSGWEPEAAGQRLEESGLSARIVGQGDTVLSQYPAAGEILPRASTVLLYTEEGAQEVLTLVPALEGQNLEDATQTLRQAGLNIQASGPADMEGALAVWQSEAAGGSLPMGSLVRVQFRDDTVVDD